MIPSARKTLEFEDRQVHALCAAIPLAAAATILLARVLPVHFEYHPNQLGIVSATTLARYPKQQEIFWFLFAAASSFLIAATCALGLRGRAWTLRTGLLLEIAGTCSLVVLLLLPRGVAEIGFLASAAAMVLLALRVPSAPQNAPTTPGSIPLQGIGWGFGSMAAAVLLVILVSPGSFSNLWRFLARIPDANLTINNFAFQAEVGQHLAWGDRLLQGQLPGRDFFCLYGPLYDLGLTGLWHVFGRSIAACIFYILCLSALGLLSAILLTGMLTRRPALALFLLALVQDTHFRFGIGLFGLACIAAWLGGGRRAWCIFLGLINATALLFSQEFGLALLCVATVALAIRADLRSVGFFILGLAALLVPALAYYASEGALRPLLRDLVDYPRYMMAGFGALAFPTLLGNLPFDLADRGSYLALSLRSGYVSPAVCVAAILFTLPLARIDPSRPRGWLGRMREDWSRDPLRFVLFLTALYGLLSFRTALARSALTTTILVMPASAVLLVVAFDRALCLWRRPGQFPLAAWRTALVLLVIWAGAFTVTATPLARANQNVSNLLRILHGFRRVGHPEVNAVVEWIRAHSASADPIYVIPAGAAYYYLTERLNPTRFDLSHQMVTNVHRAEALAALRARPPRWIVEDLAAWRVDDIPDRLVFGDALVEWMGSHYQEVARIGHVVIYGRNEQGSVP